MPGEKARCELHKIARGYFEQILETKPTKQQLYGQLRPILYVKQVRHFFLLFVLPPWVRCLLYYLLTLI